VLVVVGTRPEAVKLAPVIRALRAEPRVAVEVCSTAQHREMLDPVLSLFEIVPDYDLALMRPDQRLVDVTVGALKGIDSILEKTTPRWVVVQGDTTTTFAASLAAFYHHVPVAHVEAGLRTGDLDAPWPEELNRRLTSVMTTLHLAPTVGARENLLREGCKPATIVVTGNTVIDALLHASALLDRDSKLRDRIAGELDFLPRDRRVILVTGHRRESFGAGLEGICDALARLAERGDVEIVYPVHLNPNVRGPVQRLLSDRSGVTLIDPLDYLPFVFLMKRSHLIISDSGGIQEEAPSLGKPVLVTRACTERPEAITAGTARLVGTDPTTIVAAANELLDDPNVYAAAAHQRNPFGDGAAAGRVVQALLREP
jgi:UDP-N-acetylglucosamine 2-epimerase (non-hydrolysing)